MLLIAISGKRACFKWYNGECRLPKTVYPDSKQLCDEDFHKLRPNYGRRMIKVSSNAEIKLRKDFIARVGLIYEELHSIATKISNRYLFEVRVPIIAFKPISI